MMNYTRLQNLFAENYATISILTKRAGFSRKGNNWSVYMCVALLQGCIFVDIWRLG